MKEFDRLSETALKVKSERDALVTSICELSDNYARADETIPAYTTFVRQLRAILAGAGITIPRYQAPVTKPRSCNRHSDCNKADVEAKARGAYAASHCHDECCEECFGN